MRRIEQEARRSATINEPQDDNVLTHFDDHDVVVLTERNFSDVVEGNKYVMVGFYAPWCGHCKALAPEYAAVATELKGEGEEEKVVFVKVDAQEESELAEIYEVQGFPTVLWFVDCVHKPYLGLPTNETYNQLKSITCPSELMIGVEIDSSFFNGSIWSANGEVSLLGTTEIVDYPTDSWGDIVVEAENNQEFRFNNLETTPVNNTKRCTTFIKAKRRQCVRWANDGDIYCCVHLLTRFSTNIVKVEVAPPSADANMCGCTTVLCTRCKHQS
ncbi:Post-SET domain-containing protein [Artemisia annua]|uniref:Post-SET domain-containing protein n=1 Tax=Artemisia annua TaxID=35608 RepID=A0A2U1KKB0_ARTAN|nr:Post-SET domain-containing protein [Artemisia annua]